MLLELKLIDYTDANALNRDALGWARWADQNTREKLEDMVGNILEIQDRAPDARKKHVELLQDGERLARIMRGGRLTSCKSAKDRTSMAITLEEAQLLIEEHGIAEKNLESLLWAMRISGVRRRNVEKNIGKGKYACKFQG